MVKIEIVERNPVFRLGLVTLFTDAGIDVVSVGAEFSDRLPRRSADVLVIGADSIHRPASAATTRALDTPIVFLATAGGPDPVSCVPAGMIIVSLSRDADPGLMAETVRAVATGAYFSSRGTPVPFASVHPSSHGAPVPFADADPKADKIPLSPRETEVLRQLARGHTQYQIAQAIGISRHTVDTYIRRLRTKTGASTRADLIRAAVLSGY